MGEPLTGDDPAHHPDPGAQPLAAPSTTRTGFAAILRNRAFLAIWFAQITSQTAQNSLWYVLIIMVGHLTGQKPVGVGFTIVLVQLPTVLFSGVSGVLVDRVSKRAILIGTNVVRVVGVLGYLASQDHVAGLYAITFFVAIVSQPFAPAEGSTLPLLVDGETLITANSLFQMTFMGSQAVGFAIAPIALGLLGTTRTLVVLAALFGAAALSLVLLPGVADRHTAPEDLGFAALSKRILADLQEVVRYIVRDPPLAVALFQLALAPTLLLLLAEVGQDFLTHTLHVGETSTGLFFLLAPAGLGLGIGIAILGQWGQRIRKDRLVLISLIALGITTIGLAAVPIIGSFWQSLRQAGLDIPEGVELTLTMVPIAALMGIEVAFINAPVQTIVQQRAKPEIRGRVLAMQQTLSSAISIPPILLVGGVAAVVGTPATLTLLGLVIVCVGLAIVYYS